MELSLPITTWTAVFNGALFFILTVAVIRYRRGNGVVLGDNEDRVLAKLIRGHGNAAEQMPIALILVALCEVQGGGGVILGLLAAVFTIGRILHGAYFIRHGLHWMFRFYGMMGTLIAQIGLLIVVLVQAF